MIILLQNGTIVDGTGSEPFKGYVILADDKIKKVGKGEAPKEFEGEIVDCTGLTIAPGFIDAHSHNDFFAARQNPLPYFTPFVEQGITTQVVGNCGHAPFGYEKDTPNMTFLEAGLFSRGDAPGDFSTFSGWKEEAEKRTPLNLAPLQGYGPVRAGLAGFDNRPLTSDEIRRRDAILEKSLEEGCFGASFGLMYEPDRYATADELMSAVKIVAKYKGILTVHARANSTVSTSYGLPFGGRSHILRGLDETIHFAKETGVKVQYSHLIFVGETSWKVVDESIALIDKVRSQGYDFGFDLYSMDFGVSVITVVLPSWYLSMPKEKRHTKWTWLKLKAMINMTVKLLGFGFEDIQLAWLCPGEEQYNGMRLSDIAKKWGVSPLEAYIKLVDLSEGRGRVNMYKYYNSDIVDKLLKHDASLLMTDAWIENNGVQNASAYGSFPKFLSLVRERHVLPLEKMVRKMTGATADRFELANRGYIKDGYVADITVFNANTIKNKGDEPTRPVGIEKVMIAGKMVVENGVANDKLMGAGCILTR